MKSFTPLLTAVAWTLLGGPARAALLQYAVPLDGPSETPPVASPGIGIATVDYDTVAQTLQLSVTFSGLLGTTTAAHIHGATAVPGVGTAGIATTTPTFAGFPLGVTSGTYSTLLDLTQVSSFNPAFVTAHGGTAAGAEAFLASAMAAGTAYLNIHTSAFGGGEIRGFLVAVPETSTVAAGIILSLGTLYGIARRQRVCAGR